MSKKKQNRKYVLIFLNQSTVVTGAVSVVDDGKKLI